MKNKTGMMPANGHRIQGRSSESFLDTVEILNELNLQGNEIFMDAGCGDGHVALKALEYIKDGKVYALDIYEDSIDDLKKDKQENNLENLIPIQSDIRQMDNIEDNSIDIILMVNVFHGFTATRTVDEAISELKRVIKKNNGKIAIMDYKKQDVKHGPPYSVRSSPDDLKVEFEKQDLIMGYLNEDIGESIPEGKSHYFIVFEHKN